MRVIAALGILQDNKPLPPHGPPAPNRVWVTSQFVPFAGKLIAEKVSCFSETRAGDYVRLILNDAVVPLQYSECGPEGMSTGLCPLKAFVLAQAHSAAGADFDKICRV